MKLHLKFTLIVILNLLLILLFIIISLKSKNAERIHKKLLIEQIEETNNNLEKYGVSYIPRENCFNIFLIWFGRNFPELYVKCLETLVYHHPKAEILLFSNELDDSLIEPFKLKGFMNIHIVKFNITKLVLDQPGYDFVQQINLFQGRESYNGLNLTKVHVSDFFRLFLIYNYGGFYLDTDSMVIKNLENLTNSISVTDNFSHWCSAKVFNSPNAKNFTCISNSIFHFDRHHPFLRDSLESYEFWWRKYQGWGPGGADMMMTLIEKSFDRINFVPQREMICYDYLHVAKHFASKNDPRLSEMLRKCYTIQMLGSGSSNMKVDEFNRTLVGMIYEKFKILF